MNATYCYLPILRAKEGELRAVQMLSPRARSCLVPLFDVGMPAPNSNRTLDEHLAMSAGHIVQSWSSREYVFIDVHDMPLELRTSSGAQPIINLFHELRKFGSPAVPVTGVESDRDRDYLVAIREIVRKDQRGICLRLAEDDLMEPKELPKAVSHLFNFLGISSSEMDIVLDIRYAPANKAAVLQSLLVDTIQVLRNLGTFRSLVVAGGSMPENHGRNYQGKIRRETRIEFQIWKEISKIFGKDEAIAFGDYGVIYPYFTQPNSPVRPPARIRYTTGDEVVSYHGKRGAYRDLCEQLIADSDFSGERFSTGDNIIYRRARGFANQGNPTDWITSDTNHHLEFVSEQVWQFLVDNDLAKPFTLPEYERVPIIQPDLEIT